MASEREHNVTEQNTRLILREYVYDTIMSEAKRAE